MKILLAVLCETPEQISKGCLLWASRSGFQTRIFIPAKQERKTIKSFLKAVDDANYEEFLDLQYKQVISGDNPLAYAQKNDFDLLVLMPWNLEAWNTRKNKDAMIIDFAADIGAVRKQMSKDAKMHNMDFENGTRMVRVVNL